MLTFSLINSISTLVVSMGVMNTRRFDNIVTNNFYCKFLSKKNSKSVVMETAKKLVLPLFLKAS